MTATGCAHRAVSQKDAISQVMGEYRHVREIQDCYEPRLAVNTLLGGKLVVMIVLDPSGGRARRVKLDSSTFGDPILEKCVVERVATWKFAPTVGGQALTVTYPYAMHPL